MLHFIFIIKNACDNLPLFYSDTILFTNELKWLIWDNFNEIYLIMSNPTIIYAFERKIIIIKIVTIF